MALNPAPPEPASLKIMILSTPKTGNTWLRWLLHYAYDLPIVELPMEWSDTVASHLPKRFVTHQHLTPEPALVRWLQRNGVVVLTTVRHPGDTFLSLFHFLKWNREHLDAAAEALLKDADHPGKQALRYVQFPFPQIYALSHAWARLGAHVVRYEDLLADPLAQLRVVTARIAPVEEARIAMAALLCKPEYLTRPGLVDPRHLRTHTARSWARQLPAEVVETMARLEPYKSACRMYSYDWDAAGPAPVEFDYDSIDPFHGRRWFDNGEPIGASLAAIYLRDREGGRERWPDPTLTEGESFWNWLRLPSVAAWMNTGYPPGTLTNLMWAVYTMRPDLQAAYKDPVDHDRMAFAAWFISQAHTENELPWGLLGPVQEAYCDHLKSGGVGAQQPVAEITSLEIIGVAHGAPLVVRCGSRLEILLELRLAGFIERPVLGCTLSNGERGVIFATDSARLGTPLPELAAGSYRYRIGMVLTVPAQECFLAVGIACLDPEGNTVVIHRRVDHRRIVVEGDKTTGFAWCEVQVLPDATAPDGQARQAAGAAL